MPATICFGFAQHGLYVEAHESQSLLNWIGAHVRTLAFLGGVPEVLVPDNLKAGVKSPHLYEPDINPTYQEFARYYGVAVVPARVFDILKRTHPRFM